MTANNPDPVHNPDPDPGVSSGLEPGGSVPPGETPPAESSTSSGAGPYEPRNRGWGKGPLFAISVVVLLIAAFFLVYALVLIL
ncbi:DUF6480 family protein [Streptomyces purpureus]|uniref:Uncharacterized protein n=1 Tax=Streptomyces purpureus TaxID=1951 RepID=A0A918H9C5_9ACTN|nr:DUF6480 family protein [Streptomyces purpureus]GGT46042.1 hypothetical protein GCM10014713_44950 [Streptomyces purpureus]